MEKNPIINCHTHIFTADHVPPFLAKSFLPWPFYYLIHLSVIVSIFRWWYKGPATIPYSSPWKKIVTWYAILRSLFDRIYPLSVALGYYLFFFALYILYSLLSPLLSEEGDIEWMDWAYRHSDVAFPRNEFKFIRILAAGLILLFFPTVRKAILFLAQIFVRTMKWLPGPKSREMASRYLNLGRYAFHQQQNSILSKLKSQYPKKTCFIVLPMDMEYMRAGKSRVRYRDQMDELAKLKKSNRDILHPFVFVDPRRIGPVSQEINYKTGDKPYFEWEPHNGKVRLKDCFIKDYLEGHRFSGIKIYPALGYYPFDLKLLALWHYCADYEIPLLTHCIRGTIFYRGVKKREWNQHPVFEQAMGKSGMDSTRKYIPLVLSQFSNLEFSYNFTHPMNYLCLLEEELLRKVIKNGSDNESTDELLKVKELFGYRDEHTELSHTLTNLKICIGHFGGEDEWKRYFEGDRYSHSSQLARNPSVGISFLRQADGQLSKGKPEQLWKYTDWYSIICSLILQYPQIYADISYILHGHAMILPLLRQTLQNPGLRERVLYGTDFFVVRNHKSDKEMLANMMGGLPEADFNQIARCNPKQFLTNKLP